MPENFKHYLEGTIDRFEGDLAVIKLNDGQTLNWPKKMLPKETKEGGVIHLSLITSETNTKEREKIAKSILNELLKPKSKDT